MSSEDYNLPHSIAGTIKDNRTIARAYKKVVVYVPPAYVEVTIPNLRMIDAILDINVRKAEPKATVYGICDKTIRMVGPNPVVGFTVAYIASGITAIGTTVTFEVVAIGP